MTIKHLMAVNESDLYGRNGSYRSILCRICSLARGEGKDFPGWCTASEKYLAMTTGFSVRTVQRAIAQFRKDGVLFVRTYRRNGRKYNHYKPNMPLLEASRRKRESAVLIEEGGAHETESDGELAIRQNVESRGDAMSSSIRQSGALVSRAREVEEEKVDAVRQTCRAELRSTGKGLSKADSPKALSGKDPGGVAPGPPPSPIQREGELPRLPSGVPESLRSQLTSAADAARSRGEKLAALVAREPVPPPPSREDRDPPPASAAPLPKTKFQAARALIEETKRTDFDTYLRGYSLAFQFAGYLEERAERGEKAFAFTRWEIMYTADFIDSIQRGWRFKDIEDAIDVAQTTKLRFVCCTPQRLFENGEKIMKIVYAMRKKEKTARQILGENYSSWYLENADSLETERLKQATAEEVEDQRRRHEEEITRLRELDEDIPIRTLKAIGKIKCIMQDCPYRFDTREQMERHFDDCFQKAYEAMPVDEEAAREEELQDEQDDVFGVPAASIYPWFEEDERAGRWLQYAPENADGGVMFDPWAERDESK